LQRCVANPDLFSHSKKSAETKLKTSRKGKKNQPQITKIVAPPLFQGLVSKFFWHRTDCHTGRTAIFSRAGE